MPTAPDDFAARDLLVRLLARSDLPARRSAARRRPEGTDALESNWTGGLCDYEDLGPVDIKGLAAPVVPPRGGAGEATNDLGEAGRCSRLYLSTPVGERYPPLNLALQKQNLRRRLICLM
jgi:hypothetical protein